MKRNETLKFALMKTVPIAVSYFFVAMSFGLLMSQNGFPWYDAVLASVFVYTGAFQFVLASFLSAGTPLLTIVLTALFMNSRQVFYSLSFLDDFRSCGKMFPYMVGTLTDETYSLYSSIDRYPDHVDKYAAMKEIAFLSHFWWILGTFAGALAGSLLPISIRGIDFTLTALFLTIVMDQWQKAKDHIPALTGFACAIGCLVAFGPSRFILPSLILTSGILLARNERRHA